MKRPVYPLLICYTIGLLFANRFPFSWISISATWILLSLSLLSTALLHFRKYRSVTGVLLIAFIALGISRYTLSQKLPARHLIHFIKDRQLVTLEGRLYQPREEFPDRDRLYLEVETLEEGTTRQVVEGRVRLTIHKVPTVHVIPDLQYGDKLRIRTRLYVPTNYQNPGAFDYKAYLAHQGIYLTGSLSHYSPYLLRQLETGGGFWLLRWTFRLRERMRTFLGPLWESPAETRALEENRLLSGKEAGEGIEKGVGEDDQDTSREEPAAQMDRSELNGEKGVLQAMVLGSKASLDLELQESFRLSGLYHLLVVSGGNIGILVGFLFMLLKFFRLLSRRMLVGVIALVFLYALLTGFEPPVVRASIMVTIFLLALLFDRDADPFYSLAASAMLILILDPLSLFEASFQLTMAATAAILYAYKFILKDLYETLKGQAEDPGFWVSFRKKAQMFFTGIVVMTALAMLGTTPLIIYYFNHVYPYGLLANIPALPLSALILSLGVLACGLNFLIPPLARTLLAIDLVLVKGFISLSTFTARLPYSELVLSTRFLVPLLFSYTLFFGILHGLKRPLSQRGSLAASAVVLVFLAYALVPRMRPPPLRVTFLDVGQGDSAVVEFPEGTTLLIDGGGTSYGNKFDAGRSLLASYLWHQGITKVDVMVISHPHAEHFQGFHSVVEKFKVGAVWSSPQESRNPAYWELLQKIARRKVPHFHVEEGHQQKFGNAEVQVLHPSPAYLVSGAQTSQHRENNNSLVLKLTYGKVCFLFPGDIEREAEQFLLQGGRLGPCAILKAPHHGSATSSSRDFLKVLRPEVAVISAGKDSRFGNPAPVVLDRYRAAGIKVYRTDEEGAVRIETDGLRYTIKTFKEAS